MNFKPMKELKSIAVLTCWYGEYPWYLPYFIHSCKYNPTVDFYIITDNLEEIPGKPENVKIVFKTLAEIKKTASEKLGFEVKIDFAYKLCDIKPAYGFIFPEIIKDYDFWGHGDLDIVYGSIRDFMTEEVLENHDVINTRHDYIMGTFCLFSNIELTNTLFMQSRDYKHIFSNSEYLGFDECSNLFDELLEGASVLDFPDHLQSMTHLVRQAEKDGILRAFFDFIVIEGITEKVKWDNGQIIFKEKFEGMFYNMILFKRDCKIHIALNPIPNVFYFDPNGVKAISKFKAFALKTLAQFNR
jgi:hypothetical protein